MEFKGTIDVGQLIITSAIATIGYFVKKELTGINSRLDGHDGKILDLVRQVGILLGAVNARVGPIERRNYISPDSSD